MKRLDAAIDELACRLTASETITTEERLLAAIREQFPDVVFEPLSKALPQALEHIPLTFTCSLRERKSLHIPAG